jgi:phosphatidate phosphatase APP1
MKYLRPFIKGLKKPVKAIKVFLKQKAGWLDTPKIQPYTGYGNETDVYINGMVIEDKGLSKPKDKHRFWTNILATIKRFSSDEIPGVRIEATFAGKKQIAETDEWGFFSFHFQWGKEHIDLILKEWQTIHFKLLDEIIENQSSVHATGDVRIIPAHRGKIIVSDIDDTVMVSHSTQTWRKLRLMLFRNALTRTPFEGVAKLYRAMAKEDQVRSGVPFFYVSSSEWNLYDLLVDFFHFNQLPKGVFMLRKLQISRLKFWKSGGGNHEHKYEKIKFLLDFYPGKTFILIGDSGQHDPGIYTRLALEFPGRIEAIFIRRIRKRTFFDKNNLEIDKLKAVNTHYYEVKNTYEAALAAERHKLIGARFF